MPALLEAINRVLGAVALPATSSLDAPVPPHVAFARRMVEEEDLSSQQEGWQFNVLTDKTYWPDETDGNRIEAPATLIAFTPRADDFRRVAVRSGFFYDLQDDTDAFTRHLRGRAIMQLDLDDTPPYYRDYVAARAARRMQAQYRGDPAGARDAMANELVARATALRMDELAAGHNSLRADAMWRSYTYRAFQRRGYRR